jgi:hypothetical protein
MVVRIGRRDIVAICGRQHLGMDIVVRSMSSDDSGAKRAVMASVDWLHTGHHQLDPPAGDVGGRVPV